MALSVRATPLIAGNLIHLAVCLWRQPGKRLRTAGTMAGWRAPDFGCLVRLNQMLLTRNPGWLSAPESAPADSSGQGRASALVLD